MKRHTILLTLVLFLLGTAIGPRPVRADDAGTVMLPSQPAAPAADPIALVSGSAVDFDIAAPKLFWRDLICTVRPPSLAAAPDAGPDAADATAAYYFESIRRIATIGSDTAAPV